MRKTNTRINLLVLFRDYQAQRRMALQRKSSPYNPILRSRFCLLSRYDGNTPVMICKPMLFRSKKLVAFKNYNFKYIYCKIPLCNAMGYKANSLQYVGSATS